MNYSLSLLICFILISSIICGILIVICSIFICKYLYNYRRDRRTNRDEMEIKITENQCPLIANIDSLYHQTLENDKDVTLDSQAANRYPLKNSSLSNVIDLKKDQSHLDIMQTPNRRHSDNSPYKEENINYHIRPRSVSQSVALQTVNSDLKETSVTISKIGNYRKNSFHLKPFDLFPPNRGKISHSMEFISNTKTSYDQLDERKVRSFDSDLIRLNSKSQNLYDSRKCKTKELSKSLMSFLQKLSKIKTRSPEDKIKLFNNGKRFNNKNNNINNNENNKNNSKRNESFIDLDLAYICPFQISQNRKNNLPKNGSLESSLYISSFDSSEMNEAYLAVSREIHNSCDSDLCYKSATVKRKQFFREKRKPTCDSRKHNSRYNQCISANQSIERDYSIDEKSSTLFKEFLRNDPNYDKDIMEENVRRRLRSERGFSHQNSQHRKRSKAKVIDGFKSASFTDGDSHPQTNIHVNSFESQLDSINRSPSPLPMIILSAANPF